ncbi:unnamed protein product [Allacma fusca]|uniref:Uncharacterized protein n=1 Tax=Allacma fusca TaxID=39272 RepID=A0A8J2LSU1_9HEXA|nr:unnamed protein product [Allacma fusca]
MTVYITSLVQHIYTSCLSTSDAYVRYSTGHGGACDSWRVFLKNKLQVPRLLMWFESTIGGKLIHSVIPPESRLPTIIKQGKKISQEYCVSVCSKCRPANGRS